MKRYRITQFEGHNTSLIDVIGFDIFIVVEKLGF